MADNEKESFRSAEKRPDPLKGTEITLGRISTPASPTAKPAFPASKPNASAKEPRGSDVREFVDTIVFVVVLVLMLKTFLAEAFVIPTGSMATTLLGYHKDVACEKCGYRFRVNCSSEVEPQDGILRPVVGCWCPNCAWYNRLGNDPAGGMLP